MDEDEVRARDRLGKQNAEVTAAILAAEAADQAAALAWRRVANAEKDLLESLPLGARLREVSSRGMHAALQKATTRREYQEGLSVVRPWVFTLQWMCQTTLFCALRGCDTVAKLDPMKSVTRSLRHALLKNARNDGSFMDPDPPAQLPELDRYPYHWVMHTMHACQIVGYCHPEPGTRARWNAIYLQFVQAMHVEPESKDKMLARLYGENG